MGVNTGIRLPENVRVRDVAEIIGALLGCEMKRMNFSNNDGWAAHVDHVKVATTSVPEMVEIIVDGPDKLRTIVWTYHWEPEKGGRLLYPSATARAIAVGRKLVDFFGGSVVYNDCDGKINYHRPKKSDKENRPSDGAPWYAMQNRKMAIVPLTDADIRKWDKYAAYKMDDQ